MTAHLVVTEQMPVASAAVFDVLHDYDRRLEWDTLLRRAEVIGDQPPGPDVETVCTRGGCSVATASGPDTSRSGGRRSPR